MVLCMFILKYLSVTDLFPKSNTLLRKIREEAGSPIQFDCGSTNSARVALIKRVLLRVFFSFNL